MTINWNSLTCLAAILLVAALPNLLAAQEVDGEESGDEMDTMPISDEPNAAVLTGYHGYNASLLAPMLADRDVSIIDLKSWLNAADFHNYSMVIYDGNLERSSFERSTFNADELPEVEAWLNAGGTLMLFDLGLNVFDSTHGQAFLNRITGGAGKSNSNQGKRVDWDHPWLAHLTEGGDDADKKSIRKWMAHGGLNASKGELVIELSPGKSSLYRAKVGDGQLIYFGWQPFRSKPMTRSSFSIEAEKHYLEQITIFAKIVDELYPIASFDLPTRLVFDHPYELPATNVRPLTPMTKTDWLSHPPTRPMPMANDRPLTETIGSDYYVDVKVGSDSADGSKTQPWKSIAHSVNALRPGDTLYVRSGIYREHVTISAKGELDRPITIRAYPNELVTIDGGIAEFYESPADAWQPFEGGAKGEYVSTQTYPGLGTRADAVNLLARFGDSLIPMHGYRLIGDLRDDSLYWDISEKTGDTVYNGPGVWYNPETSRIHARLHHTNMTALGTARNYRGVTDPRQLPLIIASSKNGPPVHIKEAMHLRLQDLIVQGARTASVQISTSGNIELDGMTMLGGSTCIRMSRSQSVRVVNSSMRGLAAPWTFRSSLKYRSIESQLISASRWNIGKQINRDFEIAYCEITDSVDGVFVGNVADLRFHHNLLHNISDDGIFVTATATATGETPGGNTLIYQNHIGRCLTALAFGVGHGRQSITPDGRIATGKGVFLMRNVFDFREPVMYGRPRSSDDAIDASGRPLGDHGGLVWEPMWIYHNTIVAPSAAWRNYYAYGFAQGIRSSDRQIINNIIWQASKQPGAVFRMSDGDLRFDGNLHWSPDAEDNAQEKLFNSVQKQIVDNWPPPSSAPKVKEKIDLPTEASHPLDLNTDTELLAETMFDKPKPKPAGPPAPVWVEHDQVADPAFKKVDPAWQTNMDLRLSPNSPAIDQGVPIPNGWPDPVDSNDEAGPDVGAIPYNSDVWRIGMFGRLSIFGHTYD